MYFTVALNARLCRSIPVYHTERRHITGDHNNLHTWFSFKRRFNSDYKLNFKAITLLRSCDPMSDAAYGLWECDVRFIHRNICFYRLITSDPKCIFTRILKIIEAEVMRAECQL